MPRSNWKGLISFGLVSIPIVLYPSRNKQADISFHQIDKRDNSRIKYQRVNAATGKEVPWEQITRGYEYDKETTIPVPDEVLKKVAGENSRTIDIQTFIKSKEFDILTIDKSYIVTPDKKGEKGYVILREALSESGKIGIAKVIISTKEYIAALMPHEDALILALLSYDNEMRKLSEFKIPGHDLKEYKVNKKEIDVAKQLVDSMTSKWKPEDYVDEYQAAIHQWVEESVNDQPHKVKKSKSKAPATNVMDFVSLLKKSLNEGKSKKASSVKKKGYAPKAKPRTRSVHATRH